MRQEPALSSRGGARGAAGLCDGLVGSWGARFQSLIQLTLAEFGGRGASSLLPTVGEALYLQTGLFKALLCF